MLLLQEAQTAGANLHLSHFDPNNLKLKSPESISIEAELDKQGNLILTPYMGQEASSPSVFPPSQLSSVIKATDQLEDFKNRWKDAKKTGAKEVIFEDKFFDISDAEQVTSTLNQIGKSISERDDFEAHNDFEAHEGFNIIIMSPVAAGVGLTVIGANNVIHLERHWNPAKEAQSTDRVYRIGQKKEVHVFIPVLHHPEHESFDVNLHRLLSQKSFLKDVVVTSEQVVPNPEGFSENIMTQKHRILAKDLHRLSWQHFEALCAELFLKEFNATDCCLTQKGSDYKKTLS